MTGPSEGSRRRRLGPGSAGALVVANMIGAGVFTTSGFALADLGTRPRVLSAWLLGGAIAACGAFSYGSLARRIPRSGGEYTFLSSTFHPAAGFVAGWVSLLAGFTAPIAAAALGLQAYLADSFGAWGRPEWIGTVAIVVAGLLHGLRLQAGVTTQNAAVALKVVVIVAIVAAAAPRLPAGSFSDSGDAPPFDLAAYAVSLVWISFAYSGWNAAVYIAGEIRDPERNVQRSLWLATALVTLLYLGLNVVFVCAAPIEELAGRAEIGAIAAQALGGDALRRAVSVLVALALFTSISSMVMAGPRVYAQMAEDGALPAFLARGREVPSVSIAMQVALAVIVVWLAGLRELLGYIGFTLGLSAAATVIGLFVLRRREGPERVPVPGYPWVPGFYVVATLGASALMATQRPAEAGIGLLTALAGLPLYALVRRSR